LPAEDPDEPSISFSVRELLGRMDGKLDAVVAGLGRKADHADVAAVTVRVDRHETRIERLEEARRLDQQAKRIEGDQSAKKGEWRRWLWPVVVATATAAVSVASNISGWLGHGH